VQVCPLAVALPTATVRNRSQPFAVKAEISVPLGIAAKGALLEAWKDV
jgi:hypothetical protein